MTRYRSLPKLQSWALGRFTELHQVVRPMVLPLTRDERLSAAHVAIEAGTSWAHLMRSYYLASATRCWMAHGLPVTGSSACRRCDDALGSAIVHFKPHLAGGSPPWSYRDEPNWIDPSTVAALLDHFNFSNASDFRSALSAGQGLHERLFRYRNFVAHRNRRTALNVRKLAAESNVGSSLDPLEIPFQRRIGGSQPLICDWIDDMWAIAALLPV